MTTISFLWHLHQPAYRTADGVSHAPWAALHAGGAYTTLSGAIERAGGRGQVVNIVPTLLEQLCAYRDGTVSDPVIDALLTPAAELSAEQRELLVAWCFHVNPRQLARYPRLSELARRRPATDSEHTLADRFGPGDLRDLQVLFVLAQAGEQAWTDERLADVAARGSQYSAGDHDRLADWLRAQPGELIERWLRLAKLPGVEISTSPYAHPIMPLLVDTSIVTASWSPHPAPRVPPFRHPEDARWQLEAGLEFMRAHGFSPHGCWPPEGSVSEEVVAIYGEAGTTWLVSDEGILERSLGRPIRDAQAPRPDLYKPWRLAEGGPHLFFRDRHLSDAVGFEYGRWNDEGRAAEALFRELERLAENLPQEAHIVIALDGENPWLYYPEGGGTFLTELMDRINHSGPKLAPATLHEATASIEAAELPRLHPGSWINSVFATWIGHPEKTRAWEVLKDVREALAHAGREQVPSLFLAEGSDWFWWLGDDNPTDLAWLYDQIYRHHLADACAQAGVPSPPTLSRPLKALGRQGVTARPDSESALRYCPLKQRWTIIAPDGQQPPTDRLRSPAEGTPAPTEDPFAAGNEASTPPEIFSVPALDGSGGWQVRVFADRNPVLRVEGQVHRDAVGLNDTVSGVGAHEIIVETPDTGRELADLSVDEIVPIFRTYRARLIDLRRDPRLRYVLIFKNKGREAGAVVPHAHSQLIATPIIPSAVVQELNSSREHFSRRERCLLCDIMRQEIRLDERVCLENDRYLAIAPFAAGSPFETWILPKAHSFDFANATDAELGGLAAILRDLLRKMRAVLDDPPYNLVLHTAPSSHPRPGRPDFWSTIEQDYHWHLELVPRLMRMDGFEWGSGYTINPTPPEIAARMLAEANPEDE